MKSDRREKDDDRGPIDHKALAAQLRSAERDLPPPPINRHAHDDSARRWPRLSR